MIDLSIVIASYETRARLATCLRTVEEAREVLAPEISIEVIVVDNGSLDGSLGIVQQAIDASKGSTRLIARRLNRGFASAMNAGIQQAAGEVVLLLNSDVEVTAALLRGALERLNREAEIGVLGPALVHSEGRPQRSIHATPGWASELLGDRLARRLHRVERERTIALDPAGPADPVGDSEEIRWLEVEAIRGAVFFVRRALFAQIGLLDERYFFFLEETEFCTRARAAGARVAYCADLTASHALGESSKRRAPLATRIEFHRSLYRFLGSRRGRFLVGVAFTWRTLRNVFSALGDSMLGVFGANARRRAAERWGLVLWHLQGGPDDPALADALRELRAEGSLD